MDKIFQYLYYIFLTLFVTFTVYLTAVLYLAPRNDKLERGFIPCTKELVFGLSGCESGHLKCPLKLLWQDMKCNIGVIYNGAINWAKGEQATPWANYLFEPQLMTSEEIEQYPGNAVQDMEDIEQQHLFIERKNQEFEAAKERLLNMDSDVILYNPEEIQENNLTSDKQPAEIKSAPGDIVDEAEIDIEPDKQNGITDAAAPKEENVLSKIKKQTAEKLQKGNLKDEK